MHHQEQCFIKHYLDLRCINYDDHPSQKINFLLNRFKYTIILDRLLVSDPQTGYVLLTDPKTIKQHIMNHFQNYALPSTHPLPMNSR